MNRKLLALLAMLVLVFPLLAACGNNEDTAPVPAATTDAANNETAVVTPEVPATGGTAMATPATTGGNPGAAPSGDKTFTVGSKNFTEQYVLAELYAQALEAKGYKVNRKINLGSEQIADKALTSGQIDMYPEYTGTMLQAILKIEKVPESPEATYNLVKQRYAARKPSLTVLEAAPFDNNFGIVVRKEAADQYKLKTIADLEKNAKNLTFASYQEFEDRADARPNVEKNYPGFKNFKKTVLVDSLGLRYKSLQTGDADVGVGFLTDGQLASEDFVVLEDTKNIWPPYYPAPVVSAQWLKAHPDAQAVFNSVSKKLTAEAMRELNGAVDLEKEEPNDVASDFLEEQGLK